MRPFGSIPLAAVVMGVCLVANAQDRSETSFVLRLVAGRIVTEASFVCLDSASGKRLLAPEAAPQGTVLKLASPYNDWRYWNGVLAVAMDLLGTVLPDSSYKAFSEKNIGFAFSTGPYFQTRYAGENRRGILSPGGWRSRGEGGACIRSRIRQDGQIEGVCAGTVVSDDLDYYRQRPTPINDVHGTGAVILAGAEMLRTGER